MFSEPRNWKWLIPAMLVPVWIIIFVLMVTAEAWMIQLASLIPLSFIWLFAEAARKNYQAYFSTLDTDNYVARHKASIQTPETLIFEAARGMHPEAVRLLLQHRKKVWMIRRGEFDAREWADWVLFDAPSVHVDFVTWFLKASSESVCVSKRLLSEGSKKLDPTGMVYDRDQYDAFVAILRSWLMVTQSWGESSPPQWIPPWDPDTAAKSLGIWHILKEDEEENKEEGNE